MNVGFLYTEVCMVWFELEENLVSKSARLSSLTGGSVVNLMRGYT